MGGEEGREERREGEREGKIRKYGGRGGSE